MPWSPNIFPFSLDPTTMAMVNNIEGGGHNGEVVMMQRLQASYSSSIFGGTQQDGDDPASVFGGTQLQVEHNPASVFGGASSIFGGTQQYEDNPTSIFGGTQQAPEGDLSPVFGGTFSIFGGTQQYEENNIPASVFGGSRQTPEGNPTSIFGGAEQYGDNNNNSSIFGGAMELEDRDNPSSSLVSPCINMGYYDQYSYMINSNINPGTNNAHNSPLRFSSTPPGGRLPPLSPSPSGPESNNGQTPLINNFSAKYSSTEAIPIQREGAPRDQPMDNNNVRDLHVPYLEKQGDPRVGPHHSRAASLDSINKAHSLILNKCYHDLEEMFPTPSSTKSTRRHAHSHSMDCGNSDQMKTILANEKLMEVALVDPKRAMRILSNRQSAARSKDKKARYIYDLECRVQTLQFEATSLLAQLKAMQRNNTRFSRENNGLKLRLQAMEQEARLRDALNDALKEEIQKLKLGSGHWQAQHYKPPNSIHTNKTPDHLALECFQAQQEQHMHPATESILKIDTRQPSLDYFNNGMAYGDNVLSHMKNLM